MLYCLAYYDLESGVVCESFDTLKALRSRVTEMAKENHPQDCFDRPIPTDHSFSLTLAHDIFGKKSGYSDREALPPDFYDDDEELLPPDDDSV